VQKTYSDEEKATRKERVAKAKDAMTRSVGLKGAHVPPARAAIKKYLQNLNDPKQPDDQQFESADRGAVQGTAEEEDQRPPILSPIDQHCAAMSETTG
jgi:hypothetical protein